MIPMATKTTRTSAEARQSRGSDTVRVIPCRACGRVPDGNEVPRGRRSLCGDCFGIWCTGEGGKSAIGVMIAERKKRRDAETARADAGWSKRSPDSKRAAWRARIKARAANLDHASPAKVSAVIRDLWGDPDIAIILTAEPRHYADEFSAR